MSTFDFVGKNKTIFDNLQSAHTYHLKKLRETQLECKERGKVLHDMDLCFKLNQIQKQIQQ